MARKPSENLGARRVWNHPFPGLPELTTIGRDAVRAASRRGLSRHDHPEAMEICYIEAGSVNWWAGEQAYHLRGGQAYLTWPGEPHGGIDDVLHPSKLYWLQLRLPREPAAALLGLDEVEALQLHRRLWALPRRCFAGPVGFGRLYDRLMDLAGREDQLATAAARAALVTLLIELTVAAERAPDPPRYSEPIARAVAAMDAHREQPLPVPALAEHAGLSASHFHRRFRDETGLSPADFYLRRRLEAAQQMIATTRLPLVEVALRCGFGSSQYLASCFKRVTGRTPTSYRA